MKLKHSELVYNAPVELWSWSETSSTGRRVKLRLNNRDELAAFEKDKIQRRWGRNPTPRLGDIYRMSVFGVNDKELRGEHIAVIDFWFKGAGWNDKKGAHIAIEIQEDVHFDFFKLLPTLDNTESGGAIIWIAIIQLDEQGKPVDQVQRRIAEQEERPKGGPKSKRCARMCREPAFWIFITNWVTVRGYEKEFLDQDDVDIFIRHMLNIKSRAELDHNEKAWDYWLQNFEKPYLTIKNRREAA